MKLNNFRYLVGNKNISKKSIQPYDDTVCNFLGDLSIELNKLNVVTKRKPTNDEYLAINLGWILVRHVKSNAIVLADKMQLLGIGAGQMSRIDSVKIAIQKVTDNGLNLHGSIMASDAFFPFSDSVELAAEAGVVAVIQPGGSIKDEEIISYILIFESKALFPCKIAIMKYQGFNFFNLIFLNSTFMG